MPNATKLMMRFLILQLLFLPSLCLWLKAQPISQEERLFILSKTYSSISLYFAHWEDASIKPEELDNIYKKFLGRALNTETRKDFALIMCEFIGLLNNSHSRYTDEELSKGVKPLGFSFMNLDGRWVVNESLVEDLRKGDLIRKINEKLIVDYYKDISRYISASSERCRQVAFTNIPRWLTQSIPENYVLEFMNERGEIKEIQVDRAKLALAKSEPKTEGGWIKENEIASIKIPSFNNPIFENEAIEWIKKFKDAKVLIIDVRGNGGGSTPSRLIESLMERPYRWWAESTPMSIGIFKFYVEFSPENEFNSYFRNSHLMWKPSYQKPENTLFNNRIIILTDRYTASAAEDFVVPFKDNARALIIGEASKGSTGQPYMYNFGNGIRIGIGTKRAYMPDGSRFEGIGIPPDIEIKLKREDLYKDKDKILERALEEADKLSIQ